MYTGLKTAAVLLLGLAFLVLPTVAGQPSIDDEWPTFRRDWARTGLVSANIPDELEVIWWFSPRYADIGSSPAVAEGKVYFTALNRMDGHLYIYALDAEDGSLVWSYQAGRDAGGVFSLLQLLLTAQFMLAMRTISTLSMPRRVK